MSDINHVIFTGTLFAAPQVSRLKSRSSGEDLVIARFHFAISRYYPNRTTGEDTMAFMRVHAVMWGGLALKKAERAVVGEVYLVHARLNTEMDSNGRPALSLTMESMDRFDTRHATLDEINSRRKCTRAREKPEGYDDLNLGRPPETGWALPEPPPF